MTGQTIFLYGPPGSGKSTIGRVLAANLDYHFFDLDSEIENEAGKPVWKIFSDEGEAAFRQRETGTLNQMAGRGSSVIALGGGALLSKGNRKTVEANGRVVILDAPIDVMCERLEADPNQRPLLAGNLSEKLTNLMTSRADHYASFPYHVDTGIANAEKAAWQVQILLGTFHVKGLDIGGAGSACAYDVSIQPGLLEATGFEMAARGWTGPVALVTDDNVGPLYAERVMDSLKNSGFSTQVIQIPAGEDFKTIQTINLLWEFFLANELDRSGTVVALGGGVVSDLAGFAAATYLRGIRWVCLPTSLLSMADASIGGKTGADLPSGKNLIGAFHAPSLVLTDPDVLSTLPERELHGGLAEVIKHGIISDPQLFEACAKYTEFSEEEIRGVYLTNIICRAVAAKVNVIQQDPLEKNIRAILNAGHTIGHAVELASNYRFNHGEAVSIGLVVETRMAEEMSVAETGLAEEISRVLAGVGLPVEFPDDLDRDTVEKAIFRDKKRAGNGVKFALPVKIGQAKYGISLTLDEIRRNHAFHSCFTRS